MHGTRVPLDVDLEDRLVFGLTPIRLGYMVLSGLGGLAVWSSQWSSPGIRGPVALTVILLGGLISWGRWRGRAADAWLVDLVLFIASTRRLKWER